MTRAGAASKNIGAMLSAMAASRPDALALVCLGPSEVRLTFAELNALANRAASGLEKAGIRRGTRTAVMVRPGREFFALAFALFKLGAIPVLIDPGLGVRGLGRCINEAGPEAFIGIPIAHAARVALGWGRKTVRILVTVGRRVGWGGLTFEQVLRSGAEDFQDASADPDETAAILFTSGSTGAPKGAVYTHGIFAAQVELLRRRFAIEPGGVDVPTFPLFALFDPALGLTAVVPEMDFTRPGSVRPEAIFSAVERHQATQLFGSPALLERLALAQRPPLPSLKLVLSAGAPLAPAIAEAFSKLLPPGARLFTAYGATEALPVSAINAAEILAETRFATEAGRGVCVGRPFEGVEVRVVRITDEPMPVWSPNLAAAPGEVGELVALGPIVTPGYWGRDAETLLAKIRFADGSVGHRMGDLGVLDPAGRVWLCGRKSHRVTTPAGLLFTLPVEGVFNRHPAVRRTALVGVGRAPMQRPVLCVELRAGASPSDALKRELLALGAERRHTAPIRDILFHPSFPVDIRHNAKIFREKLAIWAAGQLG